MIVLGIDPGTRKCGFALVEQPDAPARELAIVALDDAARHIADVCERFAIAIAAIGQGTNAAALSGLVRAQGLPFALVDERETTLHARARFFRDHPPRGWRRLVPRGMLLPDRPVDDYAALLIAERYLRQSV